jgi:hypothetical protein
MNTLPPKKTCFGPRFLCLACFALLEAILAGSSARAADAPIVLENDRVSLEMDPGFGTITRILDKASHIELVPAPSLAENFRLRLIMPNRKEVTILGKDQKLSSVRHPSDGLVLNWNGPLHDAAGAEYQLAVRMEVRARGNALEFGLHVDNRTDGKVREAWYPLIGGLTKFGAPGQPADGVIWASTSTPITKKIVLPFGEMTVAYPGQANMSFTCIQSARANKSLYFASHDKIARFKCYRFQEHADDAAKDVFACIRHHPFTPPGKAFDGSTIVLRVVDGDWREAGRIYREFFISTFGLADPQTDWIRRQSFFLMTMFMLPEGTINYTFQDIPRWAKVAKDHGVNAVQISGWQVGGHDNGYPYYVPDPRLGTWKDLEAGVRACHEMGLKVFFFVNYQPMMTGSDWYKNELHKYREWNADGGLTWNIGWGMGTVWARMGHPKLETWADLGFPQYRKLIVDQFEALAKIGADGVHVDKMFPAIISYNPDSPMSPDTSTWEGAILLSQEVLAACRKHNPDWSMSFECYWDRMLQFGGCTWWVGNQRITRSIFPENAETLAIRNAYDTLGVNNAVRNGHHVMIAPKEFSRGMDWKPFEGLSDYIRDVKAIQDKLLETVFLGEVLGHEGILLKDQPARGIEYNVFRNRQTALRACILTNASRKPYAQKLKGFERAGSSSVRIHQPTRASYIVNLPASITIPAEEIVFIEELAHDQEPTAPDIRSDQLTDDQLAATDDRPAEFPRLAPELPPFDATKSVKLEDENLLIEVSRKNGAVTRIHDQRKGLDLILEPRLAGSWKFAFPLPGKEPWQTIEANWIVGNQQKLSSVQIADKKITLKWNGPLQNYLGESYDTSVTETIELTDSGARFHLAIENQTPYQVGETFFPIFGGIQGLGEKRGQQRATQFVRPAAEGQAAITNPFVTFANMSLFGDGGSEQFYAYPQHQPEPWAAFRSPTGRSVYLGSHDPSDRQKVVRLELVPCSTDTVREDGNWPRPNELQGLPVGIEFSLVDCLGGKIGKDYQAAPVFVKFFDDDRQEAKNIYQRWKRGIRAGNRQRKSVQTGIDIAVTAEIRTCVPRGRPLGPEPWGQHPERRPRIEFMPRGPGCLRTAAKNAVVYPFPNR